MVQAAKPEAIVHKLTALTNFRSLKHFDDECTQTNRLRTERLDYLLEAAQVTGTRRVIAQIFTGCPNNRQGGKIKTEKDLLDPQPASANCDDT